MRYTAPSSNQYLDWKVISTLCCTVLAVPAAYAAYIPADEYIAYTDSGGIYTVIGNVKNELDWAISPTIHIQILHEGQTQNILHQHNIVPSKGELPFIVKIPHIGNATLLEPILSYVRAPTPNTDIIVLYDETLVLHPDGHLTGVIKNVGDEMVENPSIWAVIHGEQGPLDVSRNHNHIKYLEANGTAEFVMYPDPSIAHMVEWYSCFGPAAKSYYIMKGEWEGITYDFRYESGAALYAPTFGHNGTSITIQTINSFPLETFANLEIPAVTGEETFTVYRNGESIDYIQSKDDMGLWHLAFGIRERSQDVIEVQGFVPGEPMPPNVPAFIRDNAALWAAGAIDDSVILEDLWLLVDRNMILSDLDGEAHIPSWMRPALGWYGQGIIDNDTFLGMISYMTQRDIIIPG